MLTAVHKVHWKNDPWVTNGGFEYNAVVLAALLILVGSGQGPGRSTRSSGSRSAVPPGRSPRSVPVPRGLHSPWARARQLTPARPVSRPPLRATCRRRARRSRPVQRRRGPRVSRATPPLRRPTTHYGPRSRRKALSSPGEVVARHRARSARQAAAQMTVTTTCCTWLLA